jgi:FkbM family methyltransferase
MDGGELMIKRVVNKIKRTISWYTELRYLNDYRLNKKGIYNFSKNDLELYKIERKAKLPSKILTKINDNLCKVNISKHEIFWPKSVSNDDLPWLYHEIFDSYDENPSSYNNPNLNYPGADWIIDAGCCEGYFSLFAFDINKNCSIIALEPLKEMKESLYKTFKKKVIDNKFVLEQKVLGKSCGMVKFQFDSEHLCDSATSESSPVSEGSDDIFYDVPTINLDTLMDQYHLNENGVIKMDIEGAEMDALQGGVELMKKYKPKLAVAVYHEYENAIKCKEIILKANPEYKVELRGMYGYYKPPRPYILFAW